VVEESMDTQGIAFDVNGTLVEILTEDDMEQCFRAAGHYLTYQGIDLRRGQVRDLYFQTMKEQQKSSPEEYPEFDSVAIWRTIVERYASDFTKSLPDEKLAQIPLFLAELYRGVSRRRLRLYPYVREVLEALQPHVRLALVTDAQSAYARAELYQVGLLQYFDPIIVSGDYGFRKPDRRLFQLALDGMGVRAQDAIYVGNDMHRDVFGACAAGMRTVMFDSDQGTKEHLDCVPDHTITDHRELLEIAQVPRP
jgi:putative hydrolase of the HAD superfamily